MSNKTIFTIGHSTHSAEEFLEILRAHSIEAVADVRTVPKSRHNPQFETHELAKYLRNHSINYRWFKDLGGLRHTTKDSPNKGWRNSSFRGYADYMQTDEFEEDLEKLMDWAEGKNVAIMCAEAVPWRCHRSMIADALIVRGYTVEDIMSATNAKEEKLTSFAQVNGTQILYPPEEESEEN